MCIKGDSRYYYHTCSEDNGGDMLVVMVLFFYDGDGCGVVWDGVGSGGDGRW